MATLPPLAPRRSESDLLPILACIVAIGAFGSMDAAMKLLMRDLGLIGALFWRCLFALAIAIWLFARTRAPLPRGATLRLHLVRGVAGAMMALLFFYGLQRIPIAESVAITFVAPIIALYLAAVLLGERIGRRAILASLLGLAGVAVIVGRRLGTDSIDTEALKGIIATLGSALLYAWNLILQRQQSQVASPQEIALFQNGIVVTIYAALMPGWGTVPQSLSLWLLLALAGALAIAALLLFSWAYARAEAQRLVPIEYSMFVWGAFYGWLLFAEPLGAELLAGTALIVAGCWIVARRGPVIAASVEKEAPLV